MKIILTESQLKMCLNEESKMEGFQILANKIIEFMDHHNLKTIPGYRFLQNMKTSDYMGVNMKTLLSKYVASGEYDNQVKPIIKRLRPEFSQITKFILGANNFLVDDGVAVKSLGEVIVYNTFKLNNIKLKYEDPQKTFTFPKYVNNVLKLVKKIPDFYWEQQDLYIEVAGLRDQESFGMDYVERLELAKIEIEKMGSDMVILDYYTYKDYPEGFYKYVCDKFGFPYDSDNFWLSLSHEGMNEEEYLEKIKKIIEKGGKKTRGEQDMLRKIVTRYLTKPEISPDGIERPVGYKNVKQFKKETGIGLKFGDKELRKLAQIAWCTSTGGNIKTYEKFKELFGDKHTLSKHTIEEMKHKFPDEFDMNKRSEICGNIENNEEN